MTALADPSLVDFAVELLEKRGAVAERRGETIVSLLPEELSRSLDLPEEVELGGEDAPLLYGSPVLDRLIRLASEEVPVVYGRIDVPYLKKDGFDLALSQDLEIRNAQVRVMGRAESRSTYLVLLCHYVALSDERKEGLVDVAANEQTGAEVEGLESTWRRYEFHIFERGPLPPQFVGVPGKGLARALTRARAEVEVALSDFLLSMRRRLHRDVRNTVEYYEALTEEMQAALSSPSLTEVQREDRAAKISALPLEMKAKINDLKQKYSVKVTVTGRACMRFIVPVVQLMVQVGHRKSERSVSLTWNPLTRHIDPLACEACGLTSRTLSPRVTGKRLDLICGKCLAANDGSSGPLRSVS